MNPLATEATPAPLYTPGHSHSHSHEPRMKYQA